MEAGRPPDWAAPADPRRLETSTRYAAGSKGFKYRDSKNDPNAETGGLGKGRLRAGASGKVSVLSKGKGDQAFDTPILPLGPATTYTTQLTSAEDACWQSRFEAADVRTDDGSSFKATN